MAFSSSGGSVPRHNASHQEAVVEINTGIHGALTHPTSIAVKGRVLALSGSVLGSSAGSTTSGAQWADASQQIAEASRHLNKVLKEAGDNDEEESSETIQYVEKVAKYKNATLGPDLQPVEFTLGEWERILDAAQASKQIYANPTRLPGRIIIPETITGGVKRAAIFSAMFDGIKTFVVAIQGTVTRADWVVNLDHGIPSTAQAPPPNENENENSQRFHRGLHKVAKNMENFICRHLRDLIGAEPQTQAVLFTGHSAGGAVAQFLYDFSWSSGTPLNSILKDFKKIDCITFGAPPIANPLIQTRPHSHNVSIISEGDLVPLIEPGYAYSLLEAYVAPRPSEQTIWETPARHFLLSGKCVLLRDKSTGENYDIAAYAVQNHDFDQVLFGDVAAHNMGRYLAFMGNLAARSRMEADSS